MAIDVFSRYAFAYPVSNPTAVNTVKVILDIMEDTPSYLHSL